MSLKLYYDLLSQPSRALYIFLKVCNIPFEGKLVNLGKGEHLTSEYKKVNPFQKVPAIEHNGLNMFERYCFVVIFLQMFLIQKLLDAM
ncbi:glutathione S-transferase theta-1-like [Ceratina calcarata]|uniref:Glutathione S-transferase theta-1-like n=1 Tax=Ceratina calcarata TaxID=156304 RepID=A0AAJ7ITS8_9HYME|nr:glutathione S-transferase theta-1-like [Ceratina calcarata]